MVWTPLSRRPLIAYALIALAALLVGYLLTSPLEPASFLGLMMAAALLVMPAILRWHHAFLVLSWNAAIIVFVLPGPPHLWMLAVVVSLPISVIQRFIAPPPPYPTRMMLVSLLILLTVTIATGLIQGGFGMRSLGSMSYGGKGYFYILIAILGYFALAAVAVPPPRAVFYCSLFLISGVTEMISHLVYFMGDKFWFLYALFPIDVAVSQARYVDYKMARMVGLGAASFAGIGLLVMRYGLQGILTPHHPFRFLLLMLLGSLGFFSGFRSIVIMTSLFFVVQFWLEGLLRSRIFIFWVFAMILAGALLVPLAPHLPLGVQRSLSFLPLDLDPVARIDAVASSEWRLRMWATLLPDLPKYVWLGKGLTINPSEMAISEESVRRGFAEGYAFSAAVGDYHNGPLSIYIPFGSPGIVAFLVFLYASVQLLLHHYKNGDPSLRHVNTFLLALFVTKAIFFLVFVGALSTQLYYFTGIAGLSVCLNRSTCRHLRSSSQAHSGGSTNARRPPNRTGLTPLWKRNSPLHPGN